MLAIVRFPGFFIVNCNAMNHFNKFGPPPRPQLLAQVARMGQGARLADAPAAGSDAALVDVGDHAVSRIF